MGAAIRVGLGPQPIREFLVRAGRRRLIVLELRDGRVPRSGERFIRGTSGLRYTALSASTASRNLTSSLARPLMTSSSRTSV